MRFHKEVTLLSSLQRSASGSTEDAPTAVAFFKEANLFLKVTAVEGTSPTLNVVVETQDPVGGTWETLSSFTQATAGGTEMKTIAGNLGYKLAIKYTIGGTTPSFTFSVGAVFKV